VPRGGPNQRNSNETVTSHLAGGASPPRATKLGLEEGGQTSLGTGRGAVLPPLGKGIGRRGHAEEAVHVFRRLRVLPKHEPANGTEGAEGAGDSVSRAAIVPAHRRIRVKHARLVLVFAVDGLGAVSNGSPTTRAPLPRPVARPPGVDNLHVEEGRYRRGRGGRCGGSRGTGWCDGGKGSGLGGMPHQGRCASLVRDE
jgi:hypothetical protein